MRSSSEGNGGNNDLHIRSYFIVLSIMHQAFLIKRRGKGSNGLKD